MSQSSEESQTSLELEANELVGALDLVKTKRVAEISVSLLDRLENLELIKTGLDGDAQLHSSVAELEAQQLKDRVRTVLGSVNQASEATTSWPTLPLPISKKSPFGQFIAKAESLEEKTARARAIRPFLKQLSSVRRALNATKNNHVMLSPSDLETEEGWKFELAQQALLEPASLLGEEAEDSLKFIDATALLEIDTTCLDRSRFDGKRIIFDLLAYAFDGRINPSLKVKPGFIGRWNRRRKEQNPALSVLEQIKTPSHPFNIFRQKLKTISDNQDTPVLTIPYKEKDYSVVSEGKEGIAHSAFLDTLNIKFTAHAEASEEDRALADKLRTIPALIADPDFDPDEDMRLRNFLLSHEAFNTGLIEAAQLPKNDVQLITAEEVRYTLYAMMGEVVDECEDLQEIADALTTKKEELTAEQVIDFFFSHASMLNKLLLNQVLCSLAEINIRRLPFHTKTIIKNKLKNADPMINRFEQYGREIGHGCYLGFPYGGPFTRLNSPASYLNLGSEAIGVENETNEIIAALAAGHSVAVNDTTHFDDSALPYGSANNYSLHLRIQSNLIKRIAEGRVPEALRGITMVEFSRLPDMVKAFYRAQGLEIDDRTNFDVDSPVQKLLTYNDNVLLVMKADEIENAELFNGMVQMAETQGLKVLVLSKKPTPGLHNVHIPNITESNLRERVSTSQDEIQAQLGVRVSAEIFEFVVVEVNKFRDIKQDPLSMVMQILQAASSACRIRKDEALNRKDIADALAYSFNKADAAQARELETVFAEAPAIVAEYVSGLEEPISEVLKLVKNHLLGAGEAEKPLALMLPGPTGVGKTLFIKTIAKHLGLPILELDGTNFTSRNALSRLIGSERDYKGSSEGLLTGFLKNNPTGLIFFDEFDKFNPTIRQHLMNFFDTGKIQNGNSQTFHRPAMCMLCATNAGADQLRPGQSKGQLQDIVAKSLVNEHGVVQREQTKRFEIVPFIGVEHQDFLDTMDKEVSKLNYRTAYQIFGINVLGISDEAKKILFDNIKGSCTFLNTEKKPPHNDETAIYFNLREIARGINGAISGQVSSLIATKTGAKVSTKDINDEQPKTVLHERFGDKSFTTQNFWIDVKEGQLHLFQAGRQ